MMSRLGDAYSQLEYICGQYKFRDHGERAEPRKREAVAILAKAGWHGAYLCAHYAAAPVGNCWRPVSQRFCHR
jgi:hypothetical protein